MSDSLSPREVSRSIDRADRSAHVGNKLRFPLRIPSTVLSAAPSEERPYSVPGETKLEVPPSLTPKVQRINTRGKVVGHMWLHAWHRENQVPPDHYVPKVNGRPQLYSYKECLARHMDAIASVAGASSKVEVAPRAAKGGVWDGQ